MNNNPSNYENEKHKAVDRRTTTSEYRSATYETHSASNPRPDVQRRQERIGQAKPFNPQRSSRTSNSYSSSFAGTTGSKSNIRIIPIVFVTIIVMIGIAFIISRIANKPDNKNDNILSNVASSEYKETSSEKTEGNEDGITSGQELQNESQKYMLEDHTYQLFDESLTWSDAETYCRNLGGHLVTITSKSEDLYIQSLIAANPSKRLFWIGGADYIEEEKWEWVTGETWDYSNWCSGQPNNYDGWCPDGQDFALINVDEDCRWEDCPDDGYDGDGPSDCSFDLSDYGFICEWDHIMISSDSDTANNNTPLLPYATENYEEWKDLQIGGKAYSDGISIGRTGSYSGAGYADYDLSGKYSKLSFDVGSIDSRGTAERQALFIFINDLIAETIDLVPGSLPTHYDIDLSNATKLSICGSEWAGDYGIINLQFTEADIPATVEVPLKVKDFISTLEPYRSENYEVWCNHSVAGKRYYKGISIGRTGSYSGQGYALYNLEGQYSLLSFDVGNLDDRGVAEDQFMEIYLDDRLVWSCDLVPDSLPTHYEVELTNAVQMKITGSKWAGDYGMLNVTIQ